MKVSEKVIKYIDLRTSVKRLEKRLSRLVISKRIGGARGVVVIAVVGNEHGDPSSNPGRY